MKMWSKIIWIAVAAVVAFSAWLLLREQKECCLCGSFRYHAPCLIDLKTGRLIELDLYFAHETKVAELAEEQPEQGSFSIIMLGNVSGYRDTSRKYIEVDVPIAEKIIDPALCKSCRKQINGIFAGRYVLADLYDKEKKTIIPINADLAMELRCYSITAYEGEKGIWKVTVQGNRES